MILYVFITHQKKFQEVYNKIKEMMKEDFLVVQGGFIKDKFDENDKVLCLNCNDGYAGLPEKIAKTFHFLLSHESFTKYKHFVKLDEDMMLIDKIPEIEGDYLGKVHYGDGNRNWHRGKCGNFWDYLPYPGKFSPWCMGGFGYIVSKQALSQIFPNFEYSDHIYEDVYIGSLFEKHGYKPINFELEKYLKSPEH